MKAAHSLHERTRIEQDNFKDFDSYDLIYLYIYIYIPKVVGIVIIHSKLLLIAPPQLTAHMFDMPHLSSIVEFQPHPIQELEDVALVYSAAQGWMRKQQTLGTSPIQIQYIQISPSDFSSYNKQATSF